MARKRTIQPIVVCTKTEEGTYTPLEVQPDPPITDTSKMLAWAKASLADSPGTYYFVRSIPGALVISIQEMLNFEFK